MNVAKSQSSPLLHGPHEHNKRAPQRAEWRVAGQSAELEIMNLNFSQMTQTSPHWVALAGFLLFKPSWKISIKWKAFDENGVKEYVVCPSLLQAREKATRTTLWNDIT